MLAVIMVGSPERSHRVVCSLFHCWGVWRDHTERFARFFVRGESKEITPSGVLAVSLLGSQERSHRMVCLLF